MLEGKNKMFIVINAAIKAYFVLAISANTADVNFYHSTVVVGESLDQILNKLLQEYYKLIP